MPPKRAAKSTTKQTRKPPSKRNQNPQLPPHAPQNDAEILRAFRLFAVSRAKLESGGALEDEDADEDYEDDDDTGEFAGEGLMRVADVRRCLSALDLPKPPRDFFSPNQKHINASHFAQLARTLRDSTPAKTIQKRNLDGASGTSDSESGDDEDDSSQEQQREIDAAFRLFTKRPAKSIAADRITVEDLRRVARELREDVEEGVLRMMMDEAVGDPGGWKGGGVGRDEFEEVMRRAGVFG